MTTVIHLIERSDRSRYFETVFPLLQGLGVGVVAVTVRPKAELHAALAERGVPSHSLNCMTALDYLGGAIRLRQVIKSVGATVVHCHEPIAGAIGRMASTLLPAKFLFHRHHGRTRGVRARLLSSIAAGRRARIVVVSNSAAEDASREHRGARPLLAYNGCASYPIATDGDRAEARRALNIADDDLAIAIVAFLRSEKGHRTLFRAAGELRSRLPRVLLIVAGDGPEREPLMEEAKRIDGLRVRFIGHQTDVRRTLVASDVACVPSLFEPFGLTAIEAMSAGTALIASATGGLREIVEDGKSGILVPPEDVAAWSNALEKVLSDRTLATALRVEGRRRFELQFTIGAMAERWVQIYEEICSGG